MKNLDNYIYEEKISKYIDKNIIDELYCINSINLQINEGSGLYPGQIQTAKFIYEQILKNKDLKKMEITKFPSLKTKFFDKIIINFIDNEKYEGGYVVFDENNRSIQWNEDKKIFNYIEFSFSIYSIDNLYPIIVHELKHAYRDWMNIKNKKSSIYKKMIDIQYTKFVNIDEDDDIFLKVVKLVKYFLTDFELEALINEIVESLKDNYFTINSALEDLNKVQKYVALKLFYNNIQYIISNDNAFKLYYKKNITLFEDKSEKEVKKELQIKFNRFWTKFINHLYNGLYDKLFKDTKTIEFKLPEIKKLNK